MFYTLALYVSTVRDSNQALLPATDSECSNNDTIQSRYTPLPSPRKNRTTFQFKSAIREGMYNIVDDSAAYSRDITKSKNEGFKCLRVARRSCAVPTVVEWRMRVLKLLNLMPTDILNRISKKLIGALPHRKYCMNITKNHMINLLKPTGYVMHQQV